MKEFNLSKKIRPDSFVENIKIINVEDVKEFIKRLKSPKHTIKDVKSDKGSKFILISYEELDKLAGDKLI